ncbi:Uma2 family endonuclease [soil metagenome]
MVALQERSQHVVLYDVGWQTYLALLHDLGQKRTTRLAYDSGTLEIAMPSDEHEIIKHLLERIITALTFVFNLSVKGAGSVTLSREDLQRSVEPDGCFYIQNAERVRGRRIDLPTDPPPDLVLEVDVTSPSKHKLSIYASLGVPEVWVCVERKLSIYGLREGLYEQLEHSATFPQVSAERVTYWLAQGETEDDNAVVRSLQAWVQALENPG